MKTNWQTKNIEDCLDKVVYTNKIQRKNFLKSGAFPIISQEAEAINGYWNKEEDLFRCKMPVVIFGDHTQVLKYVDFGFVLGADGVKILQPKKLLDPRFFYYFLQNVDLKNLGYARHYRLLKEIEISYPESLPEQHRIVKILDEVFADVAKAKENAEKNLQNAKELFESYLQSVFANPGKDWEEKRLGEVCDFVRGPFGGSLKKSIFKKEGYVVYEQQHAIYNQFTKVRYFIDEKKFNEMKRFELKSGDLIMSCSGTMGKIAIAPDDIKRGIINQALLKLSPSKNLLNVFLKNWIESGVFQDDLKIYTKGAAIKNIVSVKILKGIKILVPKIQEQKTIVKKIAALSAETKKLEVIYKQKLADLEELKKSVLKKAFNGEL